MCGPAPLRLALLLVPPPFHLFSFQCVSITKVPVYSLWLQDHAAPDTSSVPRLARAWSLPSYVSPHPSDQGRPSPRPQSHVQDIPRFFWRERPWMEPLGSPASTGGKTDRTRLGDGGGGATTREVRPCEWDPWKKRGHPLETSEKEENHEKGVRTGRIRRCHQHHGKLGWSIAWPWERRSWVLCPPNHDRTHHETRQVQHGWTGFWMLLNGTT